jgi:hypothetical protein
MTANRELAEGAGLEPSVPRRMDDAFEVAFLTASPNPDNQ